MRIFQDDVAVNNSGDMSVAVLTTEPVVLDHIQVCAIQAVFTGAPVGALKLQANVGGPTWTDVDGSTAAVAAAGNFMWNLSAAGFNSVRVVYTKTSGTGTMTVRVNGKGF